MRIREVREGDREADVKPETFMGEKKKYGDTGRRDVEGQGHGETDVRADKHGETETQIWGGKERCR